MKSSELPNHILQKMSPKDRKDLGLLTSEEAIAKFEAKSERDLHKQISNFLSLRGIWFVHSRTDRPTTQSKGVPDYIFVASYIPVGMEVKFGKGKLTPEQTSTLNAMTSNGWRTYTVRSVPELKEILDGLEREHFESINS